MKTSFVVFYVCNSNLAFFLITNTLRCVLELLSSYSNSSTYSQKPSQPNFCIAYFFSIMIYSYTKGRTARPTLNSLAIYLLQGPFALAQVITECCSFALTFFINNYLYLREICILTCFQKIYIYIHSSVY